MKLRWNIWSVMVVIIIIPYKGLAEDRLGWPQFRGPNASGVSVQAKPPIGIDPNKNALWKTEVPWSASSMSFCRDLMLLCTFVDGHLETHCYRCVNGQLKWARRVKPKELEKYHRKDGSPAASTPATDGRRVVSYFGSFGVICYDVNGHELWTRELPVSQCGGYGTGTSPIICGDRVIVSRDQSAGGSSLLCLDIKSGQTLWQANRVELDSFGTPVIWRNQGVEQVVVCSTGFLKGYDLQTGEERWQVHGLTSYSCPTPVIGGDTLYYAGWSPGNSGNPWESWEELTAKFDKDQNGKVGLDELPGERGEYSVGLDENSDGKISSVEWEKLLALGARCTNSMVAVKSGGMGDITQSHVLWKQLKGLPYVPSPLYYKNRIYLISDGGRMSCYDARNGDVIYLRQKLGAGGKYYSSPVAANDCIYTCSLSGVLTVIKAGGEKPHILHQIDFQDRIFATPAIVDNMIYMRTVNHLYAFGQ
jgi:outer membrane protein assembly factor BamB